MSPTDESRGNATARKIATGEDYISSLRDRNLNVFLFGELVVEPVDHTVIRPSINAVAATYDLALREPELATVDSPLTREPINRFLHIAASPEDLVMQNKMQRKLGQITGTCYQRCVGTDAFNAIYSATFEIDEMHGTQYHQRFKSFLRDMHRGNLVVGGAMTDVKGDRSLAPHAQDDADWFVRVVRRDEHGVYLSGAKAQQTGCIIFMDGEFDFAAMLVERFTCYHRRSYVCKCGVGDVAIGAAATIADYNGVEQASHIRDKLVEMTHLNETIYGTGIASSWQSQMTASGKYLPLLDRLYKITMWIGCALSLVSWQT